jgi:uncharacterized membrane protein YhdT
VADTPNGKPPASYWIIAGIFLLWNFLGLTIYYDQVTMTPEVIAENFSPAQQMFLQNMPIWATSAYAIAVTAGVIGAALLFARMALALPVFVVSLVGVLVQDLNSFVLSDGLGVWGTGALYLPTLVLLICIVEIWYSQSAKAKGWLS